MNTVAIISNGPSGAFFDSSIAYDAVIGGRTAVERWQCDWWAFCDWRVFCDVRPIGRPMIFTRARVRGEYDAAGRPVGGLALHASDMLHEFDRHVVRYCDGCRQPYEPTDDVPPAWTFSGTACLLLAWLMRAGRVDVWGMDMAGASDIGGVDDPANRTDGRWAHERAIAGRIIDAMRARGASVRMMGRGCP